MADTFPPPVAFFVKTIYNRIMKLNDNTGKLYYVGGCVRDEILGKQSVDIDLCYEGDAIDYVTAQGYKIIKTQKNIRTARALIEGEEIDFASTRKEIYPEAGHLPVTTETGCLLEDDLTRRDFTVNSIAKSVKTGDIIDPTGGAEDIKRQLLRVHHDKSFIDDPTRIIRGLKFSLRFGFEFDEHTENLKADYLNNVNYDMSYSRLKKELVDCFNLNSDEGLNRFIEEGMYKLLTQNKPQKPLASIEELVKEFDIQTPWLIYLGSTNLSRLALAKTETKIIEGFNAIKENSAPYKICSKSDIQSVILWTVFVNPDKGLHYLKNLREVKPSVTGEELLSMGCKGKQIGNILDKVQEEKFKTPDMSHADELSIVKSILNKNKL